MSQGFSLALVVMYLSTQHHVRLDGSPKVMAHSQTSQPDNLVHSKNDQDLQ
jgi:hypothetical protein